MYVCMYMYVGTYMYVHVCTYMCMYVCMYVCMCMYVFIGERSEPLSMVFNDQPRDIYIVYYTSKSGIWLVIS